MDYQNLSKSELLNIINRQKQEIDYLNHLNSELDNTGFQINSMLYQVMLNNLPFMAWLKDTTGRFIAVNDFFEKTYNLENSQIISKKDHDIVPKDTADKFISEDEIVFRDKKPLTIITNITNDGHEEWHETYKSPVLNSDGRPIALLGISRNITEFYNAKEKVIESEKKLHNLTDELPIGIYRTDLAGNFIYVNSTFAHILGFDSSEDFANLNAYQFYKETKDRNQQIANLSVNSDIESLTKITNKCGTEIWIRDISKSVIDSDNKVQYIDGIIEDFTSIIANLQSQLKENDYRSYVFENLPVMIAIINSDGKVVDVNQSFTDFFGFTKEELYGKYLADYIAPADKYEENNLLSEFLNNTGKGFVETVRSTKSGEWVDVSMLLRIIKLRDGSDGIIIAYQDIRKRIQIENKIKESEKRYKQLVEKSFDGIYVITNNGYEYVNPRFCEISGYNSDELLSTEFNFETLLTPESQKMMRNRYDARIKNRDIPDNYDITIINKNGDLIDLEVVTTDISQDENLRILGIIRDVTAKKQSLKLIFENAERFRLLAENLQGVVYLCKNDEKYSVIYINECIFDLVGKSKSDFEEGISNFVDFYHPEDKRIIFNTVNDALEAKSSFHLIYRILGSDGNYKWVEEFGTGVYLERELLYLEGVIFDITDRINLENELKVLNYELEKRVELRTKELDEVIVRLNIENEERKKISDELVLAKDELAFLLAKEKELSQMKTRFISMVSHEYRTPLTVILTSTYLLERFFSLQDEVGFKAHTKRIQDSVQNIIKLLEEVLLIGKSEEISRSAKNTNINLVSFIYELINEIKLNSDQERVFTVESIPNEIDYYCDPLTLRNIFANLLSNAHKYSSSGKDIIVKIEKHDTYIYVSIKDYGIGIPENEMKYLYEPFHRFSNAGLIQGTGLGLTVVKRAVELINAEISIKSIVNEGTEFEIRLPVQI